MARRRGLNVAGILHALEDTLDGDDEDDGLELPDIDSEEEADFVVIEEITLENGVEVDRVVHNLSPSPAPRQVLIIYTNSIETYSSSFDLSIGMTAISTAG